MTPKVREAIARVAAEREIGGRITGTAFLVTERFLLTAFHVVGDRAATQQLGMPALHSSLRIFFKDADLRGLIGQVVEGCFDPVSDWALIELQTPVGIRPIPLGIISQEEIERLRRGGRVLDFESWGFPTLARAGGSGIAIDGRVQNESARYEGAWAYQLYSDNAAAALGDPLNGLSGAPCLIDGAAVGILRSNLVPPASILPPDQSPHIAAGILYACPIGTDTLQSLCEKYIPPLDPIRGLPGLPRGQLPATPFRYLHWYGPEHAEVFFGRNRKIRELYEKVTIEESPPLVLIYGASGVGKSSLLEAGLLPRLSWNHQVYAQRREPSKTLAQTLIELFEQARAQHRITKKPIVILLDQIEEVFTDPKRNGKAELIALAEDLKSVLFNPEQIPVRALLGFRSEWLANVRTRMNEAKIAYSELHVERLDHEDIEEVVRGVASTGRLRHYYGVEVDEELPASIAGGLLTDPRSPICPVLSIILTRLWEDAKRRLPGEQRLRKEIYDAQMRDKLDLRAFLEEQIREVAKTRDADDGSGLSNDVLYRHTTEQSTAKELSWEDICELYNQFQPDYVRGLVNELSNQALLYRPDPQGHGVLESSGAADGVTRLAHDTLGPLVRARFETSVKPGQRADRILRNRAQDWSADRPDEGVVDATDFAIVERGVLGMRARTEKEAMLVAASAAKRDREKRLSTFFKSLGALAVVLIFAFAVIAYLLSQAADKERTEALRTQSLMSARLSEQQLAAGDPDQALATALDGIDPGNGQDAPWLDIQSRLPIVREIATILSRALSKLLDSPRPIIAESVIAVSRAISQKTSETVLRGHTDSVLRVFFPDDRTVLTAGADHKFGLWDRSRGYLRSFIDARNDFQAWAPSANGKFLASAGAANSVKIWGIQNRTVKRILTEPHNRVLSLVWDKSGGLLAAADADGQTFVWSLADNGLKRVLNPIMGTHVIAFSPEGAILVTGADDGGLRAWRLDDETAPLVLQSEGGRKITHGTFARDGRFIFATEDGKVWLTSLPAWTSPQPLGQHDRAVTALAVSPDGELAATASRDGTVWIWHLATGMGRRIQPQKAGWVNAVDFSPDGNTLALGADDGTVSLWDASEGTNKMVIRGHSANILDVRFSSDGRWLASGSADATARIWRIHTSKTPDVRHAHRGAAVLGISSNGLHLVTGGLEDKQARLWPLSGKSASQPLSHDDNVTAAAVSSDGLRAFTGTSGGDIFQWDLSDPQKSVRIKLSSHNGAISSSALALSPDEGLLAGVGIAGQVVLCSPRKPSQCEPLQGVDAGWGSSAAFTRNSRWLGTAHYGKDGLHGIAFLWDTTSHLKVHELTGHTERISKIRFSNNSAMAVTVSWDNTARIWNTSNGKPLAVLNGHQGPVTSARFNPDDSLVATSSYDKSVRLWQTRDINDSDLKRNLTPQETFTGHSGDTTAVDFDPSGSLLASASVDGTVRIWHVGERTLRAILYGNGSGIGDVSFSPDGLRLVAIGGGDLLVWDIPPAFKLPTSILLAYSRSMLSMPRGLDGASASVSSPEPPSLSSIGCPFKHPHSLGLPPHRFTGAYRARQPLKIPDACLAAKSGPDSDPYIRAQIAEAEGDYKIAMERYTESQKKGNDYALIGIGDLQLLKNENSEAISEARDQYTLANAKGVPFAAARLGWLSTRQQDGAWDPIVAKRYFSESADRGEADGYAGLGWLEEQSDTPSDEQIREAFRDYAIAEFLYVAEQEPTLAAAAAERRSAMARLLPPVTLPSAWTDAVERATPKVHQIRDRRQEGLH